MSLQPDVTPQAAQRRQQLIRVIDALKVLPTTLAVPMRVLQLRRSPNAGAPDFTQALSADPSLSARVLVLANSAHFSPSQPVTKLSQAVAMIGLTNLMPLVFGVSMAGIFNVLGMPAADRNGVWRSALLKATTARELTQKLAPDLVEEAFLCGLLQDVALPVLYATLRSEWPSVLERLDVEDPAHRRELELQSYGADHGEIGRLVVEKLGLPGPYSVATAVHHDGVSALKAVGDSGLARALDAAATLPHHLNDLSPAVSQRMAQKLLSLSGDGDATAANTTVAQIAQQYKSLSRILGEPDDGATLQQFLQAISAEIAAFVENSIGESTSRTPPGKPASE